MLDTRIRDIGQKGEKPLVIAYRDYNADEFYQLLADYNNFEDEENR